MDYEVREHGEQGKLLLTVSDRILWNAAEGKFKAAVLPAGDDEVWLDVNIRVDRDTRVFLGCIHCTFHFERNKNGLYELKNGATVALNPKGSDAIEKVVQGLCAAQATLQRKKLKKKK